jgi:hypothetical protein
MCSPITNRWPEAVVNIVSGVLHTFVAVSATVHLAGAPFIPVKPWWAVILSLAALAYVCSALTALYLLASTRGAEKQHEAFPDIREFVWVRLRNSLVFVAAVAVIVWQTWRAHDAGFMSDAGFFKQPTLNGVEVLWPDTSMSLVAFIQCVAIVDLATGLVIVVSIDAMVSLVRKIMGW